MPPIALGRIGSISFSRHWRRLLIEFRTRKAHRWVVRDKDLLKYWVVMITCVTVYLTSGTVSTLQHSHSPSLWTWGSTAGVDVGNASASVHHGSLRSSPTYSARGAVAKVEGVRLRSEGTRTWQESNASFLLRKARVLSRGINASDATSPQPPPLPSTAAAATAAAAAGLPTPSSAGNGTSDDPEISFEEMTAPSSEVVSRLPSCHLSLIVGRINNGETYRPVCRQLWWHYVNEAGEHKISLAEIPISVNGNALLGSFRNKPSL